MQYPPSTQALMPLPLLTLALLSSWPAPHVTSALRQPLDPVKSPPCPALSGECLVPRAEGKEGFTLPSTTTPENIIYGPMWDDKDTIFMEIVAIADQEMCRDFRYDRTRIEDHFKKIMFVANAFLNRLGVVLVMTNVQMWSSRNEIQISSTLNQILNDLKKYRPTFLEQNPNIQNDAMVLFTRDGIVGGGNVGRAPEGGICSREFAVNVIKDSDDIGVIGRVVAHELGHNLGLKHDGEHCHCPHQCIMAPQALPIHTPDHVWSSCSHNAADKAKKTERSDCLRNRPNEYFEGCGDGVVQGDLGEQCDCGPKDFCDNKCCDPMTCRLAVNATCATGTCCDVETCTPKPPGEVCRASSGECDLPEYCSGHSEACPANFYKIDGTECNGREGRCYKGTCSSHDYRCKYAFGSTSISAHDSCYTGLNVLGTSQGNCGPIPGTDNRKFKKCDQGSVQCGSLQCDPPSPYYQKTRFSKNFRNETVHRNGHKCVLITAFRHVPPHYWLVPDGAACGNGKMCINQECQSVDIAVGDCADGCSGNGVCNNLQHCHCNPGYAPPDCSTEGFGGSIDSNGMRGMTDSSDWIRALWIVIILLVGALCVLCCFWGYLRRWWKQKGRSTTKNVLPCCASCLDSCCCPIMTNSTKWLMTVGSKRAMKNRSVRSEEKGGADEAMICSIDVDVKGKKETNSWGVANEKLVTEVVTITPKNSPDIRRKVQLPSNSPVLHRKSIHDMDRPKYMQSISVDSGCGSDTDDGGSSKRSSLHMSMTSLISAFLKFNTKSSKVNTENENRRSKILGSQKSMPLSRIVVDPLAGSRNSRQGTPPPEHMRPAYSRSFSSDDYLGNRGRPGGAPPPPPAKTKPHRSEENLLKTAAVSKNIFLQSDKGNSQSTESITKKAPPVLPPSSAKPRMGKENSQSPDSIIRKAPVLPPNNAKPRAGKENSQSPDGIIRKAPVLPPNNAKPRAAKENSQSPDCIIRKAPPVLPPNNAKPKKPPTKTPSPPNNSPPKSVPVHTKKVPMPPKSKPLGGPGGKQNENKGYGWKGGTKETTSNNSQRSVKGSTTEAKTTSQKKNVMDMARKFEGL